jgi:hypothetical protein
MKLVMALATTIAETLQIILAGKAFGNATIPLPSNGTGSLDRAKEIVEMDSKIAKARASPAIAALTEYFHFLVNISEVDKLVPETSLSTYLQK